jgi:hypothetical protein
MKEKNYACKARCIKNLKIMDDTRISKEAFQEPSRGRRAIVTAIHATEGRLKLEEKKFQCLKMKKPIHSKLLIDAA